MSKPNSRMENSFTRTPICPECDGETLVWPTYTDNGDLVAVVSCLGCDYEGNFYPPGGE